MVAAIVGLPLVTCGGCVGVIVTKLREAKVNVTAFCEGDVAVGAPVAGIDGKARARGLDVISVPRAADGSKPAALIVWQGVAFSRHFCNIEHDDQVVLTKRVSYLD